MLFYSQFLNAIKIEYLNLQLRCEPPKQHLDVIPSKKKYLKK